MKARGWIERTNVPLVPVVADALGLLRMRGQPPSLPCPCCGEERRGKREARGAVGVRRDGLGWRCHRCGATGDAVALLLAVLGSWPAVKAFCEAHGWLSPDDGDRRPRRRHKRRPRPRPPSPPPSPPAPVERPPRAALEALLSACSVVGRGSGLGVSDLHRATIDLLYRKGLHPFDLGPLGVAYLLPERYPWPKWWPASWVRWRLVVRAFEPDGTPASIHGRSVDPKAKPKSLWPRGYQAGGLLFADRHAVALMRGSPPQGLRGVLVAEGVTDFLTACVKVHNEGLPAAVVGGTSGSWPGLSRVRWSDGLRFYCATDSDSTGERYAASSARAVRPHTCYRVELPEGEDLCDVVGSGVSLASLIETAEASPPYALDG